MNRKHWFVCFLLAIIIVACSDSQTVTTSTATNAATTTPTTTPLPPTATIAPTATAIPLVWERINDGQLFERDTVVAFELDAKDPDVLYVNLKNAGYYQSIDGGISWSPVQIENVPADISAKLTANNDHNQDEGYTVKNTGPDRVERMYGYWGSWNISENNGQSWNEEIPMGRPPSAAIAFDSEGSFYAYCDSSLCKYSPDGSQSVKLGKPGVGAFTVIALSPHGPNTMYVAGKGITVSKDGGLTWAKLNNGLGATLLTFETGEEKPPALYLQGECELSFFPYLEERYGFSDRYGRQEPGQPLFISNNGGKTWGLLSKTGCYLIKDADGVTLYRVARALQYCKNCENPDGWVWRSQNGGRTWEKMMTLHIYWNLLTLVAHPTQSGTLFALNSDREQQFVSDDHGYKWERKNPPLKIKLCYGSTLQFIDKYRPMAIDPRDGNHVFVIDNGKLLESHNSCDTTQTFATPPNTSMNSIAFDPNKPDTLYAGTDEGAYISFDSGESWNQINDGLPIPLVVYSVAVDKDGNVYASTPDGIYQLAVK